MKAYTDLEQSKIPGLKKSEDERIRTAIIYFISHTPTVPKGIIGKETMLAWLEKQGEKSVNKLQVSEELYEHIRNTCACIDDALSSETLADIKDYLSMAERSANNVFDMIEKQGEQKPVEWSEEDENRINRLIAYFEDKEGFTAEDDIAYANWLKSLKDRVLPQNTWKPSIAQLNALSIVSKGNAPDDIEAIVSLYNDLKKLRGE